MQKESGFTLVELAIVLVIISLIIGGLLVGENLIRAAEIRSVATDLEKYNAATTTFHTKFNGHPGDLIDNRATSYGLTSGGDGTDGLGDGDGILENGSIIADKQGVGGENALYWVHLSEAGLIPEGFNTATGALANSLANNSDVAAILPTLHLRDSADIHVMGARGRNYFYIAAITATAATTGLPTEAAAISPGEAENIDSKIDDGNYANGVVGAFANIGDAATNSTDLGAAPNVGVCVDNSGGAGNEVYNIANPDFAVSIACRLRVRTSF